jgi:hypothetical protein
MVNAFISPVAMSLCRFTDPNSVVAMHDWEEREKVYGAVLDFYDVVEQVQGGEPQRCIGIGQGGAGAGGGGEGGGSANAK